MAGPRFGDEPLLAVRTFGYRGPRRQVGLHRGPVPAPRSRAQRGLVRAGVRNTISSRTSATPPCRVTGLRSAPAPTGEAAQVGHASGADQEREDGSAEPRDE